MGKPCSLYDSMTPMVSCLRILSLSDALSCTHGLGLGGFQLGHFPTGMVTSSRAELKWAGDQKKSCPLSRALAAQGRGERDTSQADFLCWSGNQL